MTTKTRSQFTPIRPPSIPLIVRTPYVSSWLQTDATPGGVSSFWRDNTMGLTMIASVDGSDYALIGAPGGIPNAIQTSLKTTPTQSIFTFTVGKAVVTVDFLSPVEANDLRRLSMPLGDIIVRAKSADGSPHTVNVYCDITGEWAYGDDTGLIQWAPQTFNRNLDGSKTTGSMNAWEITLQTPSVLTELDQYSSWGQRVEATGSITLYVDGAQIATGTGGAEPLTAPNVLALGAQQPLNSGGFLNGDTGEVQVYT